MKALLSREPGGPETLELADLPDPKPGPGQLLPVDVPAGGELAVQQVTARQHAEISRAGAESGGLPIPRCGSLE